MTAHAIIHVAADSLAAFARINTSLSGSVNVIVGDNGAGKSHLLKLLYSAASTLHDVDKLSPEGPRRAGVSTALADKLVGVFRPEALGRLTNRRQGRTRAEASVTFDSLGDPLEFSFSSTSRTEVKVTSLPSGWVEETPVFLPTRELLSIYPGFVALYDERLVEFDETWRDTAVLLGRSARRGPRGALTARILAPLEEALGGQVTEESGRFYVNQHGIGSLEVHLLAEGLRKLGMLARLVTSGVLLDSGYLFWDEPETNLNPRAVRQAARTVVELGRVGVQAFVATHSLYFLREVELLLAESGGLGAADPPLFIGLHRDEGGVTLQSGARVSDVGDITALDEELSQADRYLDVVG